MFGRKSPDAPPRDPLLGKPASFGMHRYLQGASNLFEGRVDGQDFVAADGSTIRHQPSGTEAAAGATALIRPEQFSLTASSDAAPSLDVTVEQVQVSTDMMVKYGIGKMAKPPVAKDFVKTDLLDKAKQSLGIK